ncbi:MAG: hypothetical protein KatS3mg077_3327 [Candidatus Binatia bacterium]|nr:MAG: hypothetical protein KatS3mg077_3327 [Candidatus Binatia bacterium]
MSAAVQTTQTKAGVMSRLEELACVRRAALVRDPELASVWERLKTPPSLECTATWERLQTKLHRTVCLLQARDSRATPVATIPRPVLESILADLLWAAECVAILQDFPQWLANWEECWEANLPDPLRACFATDAADFLPYLESFQPAEVAPAEAGGPSPSHSEAPNPDDELMQAFLAEMDEGLRNAEDLLLQLERSPRDENLLHALFRQYHTLKGAAGAVDLAAAVEQLHHGESLLQALRDGELELPIPSVVDFFLRLGDSVRAMILEACGRPANTPKIDDIEAEIAALLQSDEAAAQAPPEATAPTPTGPAVQAEPSMTAGTSVAPCEHGNPKASLPQLHALREKAAKGQLDPELVAIIEALEQRAEFFASMAASLQAEVQELRTIPADELFRRLNRPLRDAARHEGKQVRLETSGGEVRIPKELGETISEILLHLVRNSVAHGIEVPQSRLQTGKPPEGIVRVAIGRSNSILNVTVADDGQGLDYSAIRAKAIALGWLNPDNPCTPEELHAFLFRPGFSTRHSADSLAGRGVGMDVVATEIAKLGGRITLASMPGHGTSVEIAIPLTGGTRS